MKRHLSIFVYITLICLFICNRTFADGLRFNNDGTFKIVQFTDTHISYNDTNSNVAFRVIHETLVAEKPDFVIFTGDVVTGVPELEGWMRLLDIMKSSEIPFCVLTGNHDNEQKITYQEIADIVTSVPNNCNVKDSNGKLADMVIELKKHDSDEISTLLYCMDSNTYSPIKGLGIYAWFTFEQIDWYRNTSKGYTVLNNNVPVPALAFFHIPLPEYSEAFFKENNYHSGIRLENECPGELNSGMFAAMKECGDVEGIFVGHDHDNDYITSLYGISLGYGRFSGGRTTYTNLQPGARVIRLYEGERRFDSYVRVLDGRRIGLYSNMLNQNRDVAFAVVADLHFDELPETDQYYHVHTLNKLAKKNIWGSNTEYFSEDTSKCLDCVIVAGDIFDKALPETHWLYKERYHKKEDSKSLQFTVYPGFGNHDINPESSDSIENLRGRAMNLHYMDSLLLSKLDKGEILNYDSDSRSYSWNIQDVHFVNMHTYAGDMSYCNTNSLDWLEYDLSRFAFGGNPVVYIQHYGFDDWAMKWWNEDSRTRLFDILDQYNVVGFFVGHTHESSIQYYRGYPIYQVNNAWPDEDGNGSFAIARIQGDKYTVHTCRWLDGEGNYEIVRPCIDNTAFADNWMSRINDSVKICKMSIPATHDSGAIKGGHDLQTQDISLEEQLAIGIRGFDIRLKAENGMLNVYHSTEFQGITWENDVLPCFVDFLKKHPDEFLVVSMKCEGGSGDDYSKLLSRSLLNKDYRKYFVKDFASDLSLKDCRGKILFIHRDFVMDNYLGAQSFGWGDNVTCNVILRGSNKKEAIASVEDQYQYESVSKAPYKVYVTLENINNARVEPCDSNKWYISYASATAIPADGPRDFSDRINTALAHELKMYRKPYGMIYMDFSGTDDAIELVKVVVSSNYK